jgi:hypothetical protein
MSGYLEWGSRPKQQPDSTKRNEFTHLMIEGACPAGPFDFTVISEWWSGEHTRDMEGNFAVHDPPQDLISLLSQCLFGLCPIGVLADWLEENREGLNAPEYSEGHFQKVLDYIRSL